MLDLLSDYLNGNATPEERIMIENALDALNGIGVDNYENVIEEILNTDDEVDQGVTLDAIVSFIKTLLYQVLKDHAIKVSEEATMRFLTDIVDGIMLIQNYEGRSEIQQTLSLELSVRERFCELMTIVTNYAVDELLIYIEDVAPSLLAKLRDSEEEEEEFESDETILTRRSIIHRFQQYDAFLPEGAPAKVRALLTCGIGVGKPYSLYAGTVGVKFEQMLPTEIAEEMFGMALLSSDGASRPIDTIKQHIEEYIANVETITQVMAHVTKLVTGFKP